MRDNMFLFLLLNFVTERCLYTPKRGRQVHGFCVTGNANLPSWSWVPEHSICEYWIYGGCGGNINRFSSFDDCMKHCDLEKQGT